MIAIKLFLLTPKQIGKQILYAADGALNDAAFDARDAAAESMGEHFVIRRQHAPKSLRVKKSSRRRLQAILGSNAEYLVDQVVGGFRIDAAVPSTKLRGPKNRSIGRARWPRALLDQKQRHFMTGTSRRRLPGKLSRHRGRPERLVFRRMGRGGRRLRLLWVVLDSHQKVKPRWPFDELVAKRFRQRLPVHFPRRLKHALKTAKLRRRTR